VTRWQAAEPLSLSLSRFDPRGPAAQDFPSAEWGRAMRYWGLCIALSIIACAGVATRPASTAPDVPTGAAAQRDAELAQLYRRFADIHSNFNPMLTPDGRHVVYASTRDGLPQLYVGEVAQPAAPARRLTQTDQRVFYGIPTHDGTSVIYASDRGADENWSYFRVPLAGGAPVELTPGETLQRDQPVLPRGAPDTLLYSARDQKASASTLWELQLRDGARPRQVYAHAGPGFLADVSRDGRQALWLGYASFSDNSLIRIDVASGTAALLYPAQGPVGINGVSISPDGRRVVVATDEGGEKNVLLALDAATGKVLARSEDPDPAATVYDMRMSPGGEVLAVGLLIGDHGELRILDAATLKERGRAKLPLGAWPAGIGAGALGDFTPDGKRIVFGWSTPVVPTDLYAADVRSGAVARVRDEPRPSLQGLPEVRTELTRIPAHDGGSIPLIVYRPAQAERKKLPVVVLYHGGPAGVTTAGWYTPARFFLSQGYAWVAPNVRGSTGFGRAFEMADNGPRRLDAFQDVETAGRWVAAQPWADAGRLVILGQSYGGYTTLIGLTRQADLWRAGVDLYGVANVVTTLETTTGVIRDIFRLEFGELPKDRAFLESISPIHDAGRIVDPLFVYAGANDKRVPQSESDMIVAALRQRHVPVEYMVAANEGHSVSRKETQIELYSRVARFLEQALAE
jgi:dipeptidyl aminopeptidase/acylaminoacyl peptidase